MSQYKKGDKFIIEIAERHTHYDDALHPYDLYRIKNFNSLVFDDRGLSRLEPMKGKVAISSSSVETMSELVSNMDNEVSMYKNALNKACKVIASIMPYGYDSVESATNCYYRDNDKMLKWLLENGTTKK